MPYCMVPRCSTNRRPKKGVSYHRLPQNVERRIEWLRAINNPKVDENTPTSVPCSHRVCSLHFTEDDYNRDMRSELCGGTPKRSLKMEAVPSVFGSEVALQSKRYRIEKGDRPVCTSTVTVCLPRIETAIISTSTPTSDQFPDLQDTSAVMDRLPGQVGSTGIQVNVPETCSVTMEKPTLQYIVDEEAILQLMKNCPMCNRKCRCHSYTFGPYLIVYQSCYFCNFQRKWASQPEAKNKNPRNVGNNQAKKKRQPKDNVSVNAKTQPSQLHQTSSVLTVLDVPDLS